VARNFRAQLAGGVNRRNHPANESKNQTRLKIFFAFRSRNISETERMDEARSNATRAEIQIARGQ
jgi:hypothetical protein